MLYVSGVLQLLGMMGKPNEFTQDAFMFIEKPNGPIFFYGEQGEADKSTALSVPDCFFLS